MVLLCNNFSEEDLNCKEEENQTSLQVCDLKFVNQLDCLSCLPVMCLPCVPGSRCYGTLLLLLYIRQFADTADVCVKAPLPPPPPLSLFLAEGGWTMHES